MVTAKQNIILERTLDFAIDIVSFCEELESKKKFVISRQLLKSGTSIGANIREAQGAESKKDFIHKLKISYKEAEETEYWLIICRESKNYPFQEILLENLVVIKKILNKIISSTKSISTSTN
ncbi:MAG: four helix bundle protein [Bacteroidia bacterium]